MQIPLTATYTPPPPAHPAPSYMTICLETEKIHLIISPLQMY